MEVAYWKTQQPTAPIFPDIEWGKPEQRAQRGRLGIVGGNKLGFTGVATSYDTALATGAGEVRVLLPDTLRASIPRTMTDVIFGASNPSGSLAKDAHGEAVALSHWAQCLLFAGDAGRNSETAILYSDIIRESDVPLVLTRDAIDLVKNDAEALVNRPHITLVLSFAQLQKLFQSIYYPKMLTFSMQLLQLVDALHAFTITYPCAIVVLHRDTVATAYGGTVITTSWDDPMRIWRGYTAARAATYLMWTPNQPLEAIATSLIETKKS